MLINTDTSKVMHFRPSRKRGTAFEVKIGDNILNITEQYKYLGVIFHEKKKFDTNAENLSKAPGRALGALITKIQCMKECGFKTFQKLFNSCVVPILDYNSSVWGFKDYPYVDNVQNKASRYFLGVHKFAPKLAITGDMGWLPSCQRRHYNMIRYWNRLMDMPDTRLCKQVFNWDQERCLNNWSSEIKAIMNNIGLAEHFTNKYKCDLPSVNDKLLENYAHEWKIQVDNTAKLRTSTTFKFSYKIETYVEMNLTNVNDQRWHSLDVEYCLFVSKLDVILVNP